VGMFESVYVASERAAYLCAYIEEEKRDWAHIYIYIYI